MFLACTCLPWNQSDLLHLPGVLNIIHNLSSKKISFYNFQDLFLGFLLPLYVLFRGKRLALFPDNLNILIDHYIMLLFTSDSTKGHNFYRKAYLSSILSFVLLPLPIQNIPPIQALSMVRLVEQV